MPKVTLKDDIRSTLQQRISELEPLIQEYEELSRIMAAIEGHGAPPAGPARAVPDRAPHKRPGRRRHGARTEQAQQLIAAQPGISVAELANKMGIGTTYLYRLLPRLEREGKLRKQRRGYHPPDEPADGARLARSRPRGIAARRAPSAIAGLERTRQARTVRAARRNRPTPDALAQEPSA